MLLKKPILVRVKIVAFYKDKNRICKYASSESKRNRKQLKRTIRDTRTYLAYDNVAMEILHIKITRSNNGRKITTPLLTSLSSPQGILLKKGINGGRPEYEKMIMPSCGIRNINDNNKDILTNWSEIIKLNFSFIYRCSFHNIS